MSSLVVALDARLLTTRNTGDTSYWRGLVQGLAQTQADARFLLYTNAPSDYQVPNPRFELKVVPAINSRWWSLVTFPLHARRSGAQVLHTQYNVSPLAGPNAVTTVHDVSFFIEPDWFKPKDRMILQKQIPASIKRAAKVITVSETSKTEIETHIPAAKGKTVVTYNALGENIRPLPKEQAQTLVKQRLDLDPPYLFTLGTTWPRKNTRLAIESVAKLSASLPHKLVVTGHGGWADLPENDRTLFTGYLDDDLVSALYSAADLYLASSLHEGFGIPLLEAWACDCPVICGNGGALPEIAQDAAIIPPDYEVPTWTQAVTEALTDSSKLQAMRERGHRRLQEFSWKQTAEKTLEIYREVAGC